MPFLAEQNLPIPNKDLLSWMFDEPGYDVDKPVRALNFPITNLTGKRTNKRDSIDTSLDLHRRLQPFPLNLLPPSPLHNP
jgi:hypothetical protein